MDPLSKRDLHLTRRHFFGRASAGLGTIALASLLDRDLFAADRGGHRAGAGAGIEGFPNFAPRARRVIYLFQSGAPSQLDLFDPKPGLDRLARHRSAGLDPDGTTADGHDLATGPIPGRGQPVLVSRAMARAARRSPNLLPLHGKGGRRAVLHQDDAHRGDQPRPGRHLFPDGRPARRAPQHRRLGRRTAWGARTRTCRPSWS